MFCCISNQVPTEPVVARQSGCLFERRLIEKYIADNGRCPKTGEPLRKEDLVAVACGVSVPRTTAALTSIPGLLQTLHHEWDALMLEQFSLRQEVTQVKQELSHALFQHDAACRVIAKLMEERDALKKQLAQRGPESKAADNEEDVEEDDSLPPQICEQIDETERRLSQLRKHRDPPRGLATPEMLKSFVEVDSAVLHANAAVTAIEVSDFSGSRICLSGGADGKIIRYDAAHREKCGVGVGHNKAVRCVKDLGDVLVSCSDDATVRVWRLEGHAIANHLVIKAHDSAVNGFCVLPGEKYVVSGGSDGVFAFSDIATGFTIKAVASEYARSGISSLTLHPDGHAAATGTGLHALLWDVRQMEVTHSLSGPKNAAMTSVAFNEDGYTLAASTSSGVVLLWDLRKPSQAPMKIALEDSPVGKPTPISKINFDKFGSYLAIASDSLRIWDWKRSTQLTNLCSHILPLTDVAWGSDATWIASASHDKYIRIYGSAQ